MLLDECLELSDQLIVAPEDEVSVDPELERCEPDLLEPGNRRLSEALVREVGKHRAPPKRQCLAEPRRRVCCETTSQQASPLLHETLEAMKIERVGLDSEQVPRRPGRQHVGRERLAKP